MQFGVLVATAVLSLYEGYSVVPNTSLPWVARSVPKPSLDAAKTSCDADPSCSGFTSNGTLKYCDGGRCTCEISGNSCPEPSVTEDLYIKTNFTVPPSLQEGVLNSTIYYDGLIGKSTPSLCYQPEIGNGYLATNINWDAIYISGLYNGKCGSVHKARIPSFLLVDIEGAVEVSNWLDIRSAVFHKKWLLASGEEVLQSFYAHRTNRHLIVMEFSSEQAASIKLLDRLDINSVNMSSAPGNSCAGKYTKDFTWTVVKGPDYTDFSGNLTEMNDKGEFFTLTVRRDSFGPSVKLSPNETFYVKTTFLTNLPDDTHQDISTLHVLTPFVSHLADWGKLHESGVDIFSSGEPSDTSMLLDGVGLNFYTHSTISRQLNSSLYFLRSSLREDWPHGISPGGISTQNYQGAVFFDMDTYMSGSLFMLNQNLSRSCLQYRFNSLNESRAIAKLFGYKGSQFAWTSAYHGAPFGCCSGKGGYENCLEQHITGDIGVAVWQYFAASNDTTWLREVGHPILDGIKDWVVSRGTAKYFANNTLESFDISGILPVDEWCVGSGCGCETPGITNDAQTNAVLKLSVEFFLKSAALLNIPIPSDELAKLEEITQKIPILFNATHSRHTQFTSETCPNGFGGTHYTPRHTVCPDDVMYLSYPFGDLLGTSDVITKHDYDFFVPITCKENSGMTTPIHAVSQLSLKNVGLFNESEFEAEFYRSMHGGVYGPFNVRNEVDKHPNIVGGHFDNTHFLTGDGGFIHIFVSGFAGLRLVTEGLSLKKPSVPKSTSGLRVRGAQWRGFIVDVVVTETMFTLTVKGSDGGATLCVVDAKEEKKQLLSGVVEWAIDSFEYPGILRDCQM